MPDENPQAQDSQSNESQSQDGSAPTVEDLMSRLEQMESRIAEVNQESAARRHKIKELEEEREALKQAQMARLEQEGNYKALAEERAKKLTELETYQERAAALEATIREANDARIASIPEHMRSVVPTDYSPDKLAKWLDNNASVLSRPQAPELGAGVAGGNGAPIKLTAVQIDVAKRMGMTEEDYAAALKKMGQ